MSVAGQILLALAAGSVLGLAGAAALLVKARRSGLFSSLDAGSARLAGQGARPATRREQWQFTGIVTLVLLALLALVYAWTIGFGAYGGIVEEKSVSSRGRYGDYTLRILGEYHRVSSAVNALARTGSEVVRSRARPYVLVDGQAVVMTVPLAALGLVGTFLTCLWALVVRLIWSESRRRA